MPVSSAVEKLTPYYRLSKEQISEALLSQVPMTTAGYVYTTTNLPAHYYKMAADFGDAAGEPGREREVAVNRLKKFFFGEAR